MKQLAAAILSALEADATVAQLAPGGVWQTLAAEGTAPPYVVFHKSSGVPTYTARDGAVAADYVYVVKGIVDGFDTDLSDDLAAAIDAVLTDNALKGVQLADAVGTILVSRKSSDVDYPETDQPGRYLQHRGGAYRIVVAVPPRA